ncbi:MAG: diversity-generating retroelement protein Avd [Patescibacteria group bacterium]
MVFDISIVHKVYKFYLALHTCTSTFPKKDRHTIGQKCENLTLNIIELLFSANAQRGKDKMPVLSIIDIKLKVLKTMIRLANDSKALEQKQYIVFEASLDEIGKMLGGWIKSVQRETSA